MTKIFVVLETRQSINYTHGQTLFLDPFFDLLGGALLFGTKDYMTCLLGENYLKPYQQQG